MSRTRSIVCVTAVASLLVIVSGVFLWPRRLWMTRERQVEAVSFISLSHIGEALTRYQQRNQGALPATLSAMIPEYISVSNLVWFYPPYNSHLKALSRTSITVQVREVDDHGAYVYLSEGGRQANCVAHERPEVLPPSAEKINVLTSNLTVRRIPLGCFLSGPRTDK